MFEKNYVKLINDILDEGDVRCGRNGYVSSKFGCTLTIVDLEDGYFPLLSGRKIFYPGVLGEFAAFIRGPKTLQDFEAFGCNYWKDWAKPDGSLDVDYGNQWLDFNGVNQIEQVISSIDADPFGRRHIINGWRPDRLNVVDLPCCHFLYQFYVTSEGKIDLMFYMRSVDVIIGLPSDVILAALMVLLIAQDTLYKPGKIHMILGDTHIYEIHHKDEGIHQYLENYYSNSSRMPLPTYSLCSRSTILQYEHESKELFVPKHLHIQNYEPIETIKFEVAP